MEDPTTAMENMAFAWFVAVPCRETLMGQAICSRFHAARSRETPMGGAWVPPMGVA